MSQPGKGRDVPMNLVLKDRAGEDTEHLEHIRRAAESRMEKISRLVPRAERLEIEIIGERGLISNGAVRLEGAIVAPRWSFRASSHGHDTDAAVDQLLARLERQVRDHHDKRRTRLLAAGNRLKSARTTRTEAGEGED